jgi:hypothetical protein
MFVMYLKFALGHPLLGPLRALGDLLFAPFLSQYILLLYTHTRFALCNLYPCRTFSFISMFLRCIHTAQVHLAHGNCCIVFQGMKMHNLPVLLLAI